MDTWKVYGVIHREYVVCNPMSEETLARLAGLLRHSSVSPTLLVGRANS